MRLFPHIKVILLMNMLIYTCLNAQVAYEIRFNTPNEEDAFRDPVCDSDGNTFVTYGYALQNMNHICSQAFIYKIDPGGDTVRFEIEKQDTIFYFLPVLDSDGNILLFGEGYKFDSIGYVSGKFQFFSKINTGLEILWERIYHLDSDSDVAFTTVLSEFNQNSYIQASMIKNLETGEFKMHSFKMDKEGDSLNFIIHDRELLGSLYSMTFNPDDTSLIEYHLTMWEYPTTYCGRLLMDESFNLISRDKYSEFDFGTPFFTMRSGENNYISTGSDYLRDYIQVRKMDNSLNSINSINLCYSEHETCPAWVKCMDYWNPDRIFVAAMSPYYSNAIPNYIYVACLDSNLNLIDEEYIGGDAYYDVFSIAASPDGGVIIAGSYTDVTVQPLQIDGYLIKLDSSMFVGIPDNQNDKNGMTFRVSPNPVHDNLTVNSNVTDYDFEMIDLCGRIKYQNDCHSSKLNIDASFLPPGVYIWKATFNYQSVTGKLLIY